MKYVFFGITAPDGNERGCLVSYYTDEELELLVKKFNKKLQGGTIHTVSTKHTEEMLSKGSKYTLTEFLEMFSF